MTAWTTLPNGAVAAGGLPSGETVTALRDNVAATAEGSTGSPVVAAGWHPYNKVTVGDSNTGLIYDFAVSGAVASVITPDFANGYEYAIWIEGVSLSAGALFRVDLYKEVDAAYQALTVVPGVVTVSIGYTGLLRVVFPRLAKRAHVVTWETSFSRDSDASDITTAGTSYVAADITLQTILRARVQGASGNISAGKIYLYRRREYVTG